MRPTFALIVGARQLPGARGAGLGIAGADPLSPGAEVAPDSRRGRSLDGAALAPGPGLLERQSTTTATG